MSAVFSPCRTWRYTLTRELGAGPSLMVIGLNPSTADETQDDPTIRRCIGYARKWGMGRLVMTNIFGLRSTDPRGLKKVVDPVGPQNDSYLFDEALGADMILAAWGMHGGYQNRDEAVLELLGKHTIWSFGQTNAGRPPHPLYLPYEREPVWYAGPELDEDALVRLTVAGEAVA